MADSDGASSWKRDSHYNQQRSSLRSDSSYHHSRPQSRSQSPPVRDGSFEAPIVPRLPQHRSNSRGGGSRARSKSGSAVRRSSRGNIDELLFSDQYALDEVIAPPPIQNPRESSLYEHLSLEEAQTRDSNRPRGRQSHDLHSIPGRGPPGIMSSPAAEKRRSTEETSYSTFATTLYSVSYLIIFSILGTLARLGVQWLTFYPGTPSTFPVLWANFGGTLFMGFLSQDQRLFRSEWGQRPPTPPQVTVADEERVLEQAIKAHAKVKKTIPLYIGLATGFCGSFTSFSSFMRDIFLAFLNDLPAYDTPKPVGRNDGYSFMAGLAVVIITVAVSFAALKVGAHIAVLLDQFTPTLPFRFTRKVVDPIVVFLAWGAWLGAVILAIFPPGRPGGPASKGAWSNETWRGQAIFACVFAPAGCLLRFYVSLKLNPLIPSFPLGTFCVNIFGTAVLGMAYDLQHVQLTRGGVGGGRVGCQVLQGIMDGFDGCLTTVSTWILEIETLRRAHAWKYAFASVVAGIAVLVVIMGSVRWSVGWMAPACVT